MRWYHRLFLSIVIWGFAIYFVGVLQVYLNSTPRLVDGIGGAGIDVAFVATIAFIMFPNKFPIK
jgi:hypothetical protein